MDEPTLSEDMLQEEDRFYTTDSEYWYRLGTATFDDEDVAIDAQAEAWETKYNGQLNKGKHLRLGPKPARLVTVDWTTIPQPTYVRPEPSAVTAAAAPAARSPLQPFNAPKVYELARDVHEKFFGEKVTVSRLNGKDAAVLVAAYNHMLCAFEDSRFQRRYGFCGEPHHSTIEFGAPVPSYFANVGGQSIYYRKVLSMAGLRNLIEYGPVIYGQLESKLFSGNPSSYDGSSGLHLMRTMTGNVVDLDTTVLRCNDRLTLDVINISNRHKGLPQFSSTTEFSSSSQAAEIAINCSRPLLEGFVARFKLNEAQAMARNVHPSQLKGTIPVASDNSTRGHCALWHYVNAGQDSFHANVPTMEDVVGALLRAPFACVEHYASLHLQYADAELQTHLDEFFEHCVADSCFNMKWKAIEEFGENLRREGTIVDVLQKVQAKHQGVFTAKFFDGDNDTHDKEVAAMTELVNAARSMGRDKAGRVRPITAEDVRAWVTAAANSVRIEI